MPKINSSSAFMAQPMDGLLYVIVDDRATFEGLPVEATKESFNPVSGSRVLSKSGLWNGADLIFQFVLPRDEQDEQDDDDETPPLNEGALRVIGNISLDEDPPRAPYYEEGELLHMSLDSGTYKNLAGQDMPNKSICDSCGATYWTFANCPACGE